MRQLPSAKGFAKFLVAGGINTLVTYAIYLGLLAFMPYALSYTIAYVTGIALAFVLNRFFVFKSHRGACSVLLFPLVYAVQYVVGVAVLWLWIDVLGMGAAWGPFVVVVVSVPVTFLLSRRVFVPSVGAAGTGPR